MCRLIAVPCFTILLAAVGLSLSAQAGGPGPDETADVQTYEVQLDSRHGGASSGQMMFLGDPLRPQAVEVGVLSVSLSNEDSDSSEPPEAEESPETPIESVAAEGTWASAELWFFSFWLAVAESESGDRLFAYGLSRGESIFGRAMILGGETLDATRYRLCGDVVAAESDPVAPEIDGDP